MRLLVLGGTRFVGRHLVDAALDAGHEVTVFHRGKSGRGLWKNVEEIIGDRETDLEHAFGDRTWDVAVDTSAYVPRVVRMSLEALEHRVDRYVFVSTISVYASFDTSGQDESAPLSELDDPATEEVTGETYGGLKVLCEREVMRKRPDALIVRPGIIVGPEDYTDRFTYWVDRIARGGEVACPGPPDLPIQMIDGRDLGAWIVRAVERGVAGTFNAVGPREPLTFEECLTAIREATDSDARFVWLDEATVRAAGLEEEFPLWSPPGEARWRYVFAIDGSKALAQGLQLRPLEVTVRDTLDYVRTERSGGLSVGIDPEREKNLLGENAEVH
jgi:2'-hydroxyisoflavone reductase